jgi:tetratricopeptide (TPR) repeat protein
MTMPARAVSRYPRLTGAALKSIRPGLISGALELYLGGSGRIEVKRTRNPLSGYEAPIACLLFFWCLQGLFLPALFAQKPEDPARESDGRLALEQKKYEAAVRHFRLALQSHPDYPDAIYNLALAEWRAGDRPAAARDLEKLISLQAQDPGAHFQLGRLLRETGDRWGAVTELLSASALEPQNLRTRYELAWSLIDVRHFDDALAEFRAALQVDPRYAPAHYGAGVVRELTEEGDKGASEFREAVRLKPDFAEAYAHLARVSVEQRNFTGAWAALSRVAELKPNDPALHYVKGLYFKGRGNPEKALKEFQTSVRMAPRVPEPHYELGLLLRERGELENAADEFRKVIELNPGDGPSFLNLGQILGREGKTAESQELLGKFQEVQKNRDAVKRVQAYNDEGIRLAERGDLSGGIRYFRAALDLRPDYSEIHRNLAKALLRAGELEEAGKEFETAIRLNPHDWQAHCGLGEVLGRQDRVADGIKEIETAAQLNPRYAEAYDLLSRLYRRVADTARAEAAQARAKSLEPQMNTGGQEAIGQANAPAAAWAAQSAQP